MRPILFRGQRKDGKGWIIGALIQRNCDGQPCAYIYNQGWDETEIDELTSDDMGKIPLKNCFVEVDPASVGQGFEVGEDWYYEGDKIKARNTHGSPHPNEICCERFEGVFFWDLTGFRIKRTDIGEGYKDWRYCDFLDVDEIEVIGNLTDTPGLGKGA